MHKNIYLCLLLTALVVQNGYNTKTKLQQLAEGIIDGRPPKNKNKTKNKENLKNKVSKFENEDVNVIWNSVKELM